MNTYEQKREARIERLHDRAAGKRAEGERRLEAEHGIRDGIPLGQPILVGHHSERRHRRDLARADGHLRAGMAALDEAKDLERRAAAAEGNQAVSSDDPEAVEKLRAKLASIEAERAVAKAINRAVRSKDPHEALEALGLKPRTVALALEPDDFGRPGVPGGVPGWRLRNLGAEARRIEARIAQLETQATSPKRSPLELPGGIVVEQADNRCRVYFPGKPAEAVRAALKGRGFRWAPSEGAWQRHASEQAWYQAQEVAKLVELPHQHTDCAGQRLAEGPADVERCCYE